MSLNRFPSIFGSQKVAPVAANTSTAPTEDQKHDNALKVIQNFRDQIKRGVEVEIDTSTLSSVLDAIKNTNAIDDRKLLLEHLLTFLSRLPTDSWLSNKLQNATVELLYNDLGHPPATYIGTQYAWRTADGSYNNICDPDMGKAGTPYSRSVQQTHAIPADTLPDPGLVFDTLLRREGFVNHPAGLSSMMFSFAALVIHSVFRTSHRNVNINETSSYVDLSPLYGHDQKAQDKVRVRDGFGILKPDVFAEDRLLLLPPAVCVILTLFSRNHNYIAKKIYEINERGKYVDPSSLGGDPTKNKQLLDQEEEIFQTARLCNCAWFASVVFSDYFSCILGLVRDGSSWSLNPFGEIRNEDHSFFERGKGNVCSVEFNCLYRWHATTSQEDDKWIQTIFGQIFPGLTPDQITPQAFASAALKMQAMEPDVSHWTFGNMQRQEDGTFKDEDLGNILKNATEHPAGAFRARGTPPIMRLHEIMGITQNRAWGVCSLNDFRRFLGLKPYASFKEWNPRPEINEAAEKLYGDIERLELYVGLQAEEAKPVVEGAGLCPGYTISRAILSDAIALTRGDRFYTSDYTPFNMTAWGFADCQRDPGAFGFGSTLGRLLLRTLPEQFTNNSSYAFFPLMTPDSMKINLTKLNKINQYDLTRPGAQAAPTTVTDYAAIAQILKNTNDFVTPYARRAATVISGPGFFTASDDAARGAKEQREVLAALLNAPDSIDKIAAYFSKTAKDIIAASTFAQVGSTSRSVDIVRDVIRYLPIHWAATEIAGIKLKTSASAHGVYTLQELYDILGRIYQFIFLEVDSARFKVLQGQVKGEISTLLGHIKTNLGTFGDPRFSIAGIFDAFSSIFSTPDKNERIEIVERLHAIAHSTDHLANMILAILVGSTVELSLAMTNTINLYLGSDKSSEIVAAANLPNATDGYVRESLRLDPPFAGSYRYATKSTTVGNATFKQGDYIFLDIVSTSTNDQIFPSAQNVDPTRPVDKYLKNDYTTFPSLGEKLTTKLVGEVLGVVFSLKNVRRAPGQSGVLRRFKFDSLPIIRWGYLDINQFITPWPTSLTIQYDA